MLVLIDRAGRVMIPKEFRDRLSLEGDTELDVEIEGDALVLRPVRHRSRRVIEVDGLPVVEPVTYRSVTDADVLRWRDAARR